MARAGKPLILVVEDETTLNEAYQTILTKEGYQVATAYNGEEAIEKIRKDTPDLILLDLRMPKMDGIEFLRSIDAEKNLPKTKIIIFSNYDAQKEIDEAYRLGAQRYILKAWATPKELVHLVKETLSKAKPRAKSK